MNKKLRRLVPLAAVVLLAGCQKNDGPNHVDVGMTAIENKDYQGAIEEFNLAVSEEESDVSAYRGTGIAYMGLGDYEKAVEAFDRALLYSDEKMPNTRRDVLYYKASALYKAGKYDDTVETCGTLISLVPEGDAYYLRGACYMELEEYDLAKLDFDKAAALSPGDYDLFLNIYGCYLDKKRSADGDAYLKKALDIHDSSVEGNCKKAQIYFFLEEYDEAQSLLNPLVENKNQDAMELMGKVYLAMEDTTHARKTYQELIESYGGNPENYNGLVLCDLKDKNYDSALDNVIKGKNSAGDEGRQELLYNEIVVWEYQGDFVKAKEKAGEYVEQYPADERGKREYTFLSTR